MAKLPVYNTDANVRVAGGVNVPRNDYVSEAVGNLAKQGQELALQWQKTQNESEWLDGKNKVLEQTNAILNEAKDWTDYQNPKDIEAKQKELEGRLNTVVSNVAGGFTNQMNANRFSQEYQLTTLQNTEQLKGIFREKFIDNNNANLLISENNAKNAYINSGNKAYKDSYLADLQRSFEAKYITEQQKAQLTLKMEEWDELALVNQMSQDPEGYLEKLKNGELKGYKQTEALSKALKKAQEMQDLQRKMEQYTTTQNVLTQIDENDVVGSLKLLDDNRAGMDEKIYKQARKNLLEVNGITAETQADEAADLLLKISSLPVDSEKIEEFYSQTNEILAEIEDKYSKGQINLNDKKRLVNNVYQRQGKNLETLKSDDKGGFLWGFSFEEANKLIEDNYTAGTDKNKLFMDYFRAVDGKDYSGKEKKKILTDMINQRMDENFNKVIQASMDAKIMPSEESLKLIGAKKTQNNDDVVKKLANKKGVSIDEVNKLIDVTAKNRGLSREQVIKMLGGVVQ